MLSPNSSGKFGSSLVRSLRARFLREKFSKRSFSDSSVQQSSTVAAAAPSPSAAGGGAATVGGGGGAGGAAARTPEGHGAHLSRGRAAWSRVRAGKENARIHQCISKAKQQI